MTNGEKMQEVYQDIEKLGESENILEYSLGGKIHRVAKSWWNAEYKESTVKNLCDTCGNSTNCVMQSGIVRTECEMYKHSKNNLGISIGEAIEMLKFYNHGFTGYAGNLQDSIDVAVDTMRKYQKIEEILKEPCIIPEGCYPKLKKIKEVIENDKDN